VDEVLDQLDLEDDHSAELQSTAAVGDLEQGDAKVGDAEQGRRCRK
jgi:hypothetical protein